MKPIYSLVMYIILSWIHLSVWDVLWYLYQLVTTSRRALEWIFAYTRAFQYIPVEISTIWAKNSLKNVDLSSQKRFNNFFFFWKTPRGSKLSNVWLWRCQNILQSLEMNENAENTIFRLRQNHKCILGRLRHIYCINSAYLSYNEANIFICDVHNP